MKTHSYIANLPAIPRCCAIRDQEVMSRPEKHLKFKRENKGWEVSEAITVSRRSDGFNWSFNGKEMMHERVYFPWNIFKEISYQYWPERIYTDKKLAERDAKKYNGEVTECFYSDENNPTWFVLFTDFDLAAKYCEETQGA